MKQSRAFLNWLFPLKYEKFHTGTRVSIHPSSEDLKAIPVAKRVRGQIGKVISTYLDKVLVQFDQHVWDRLTNGLVDKAWFHKESLTPV